MRSLTPLIPWLLWVGSCASPPKPPTVDESLKRPANSAMAVELQVCKSELQNTRILAGESGRLADLPAAARMAAYQQALAARQGLESANSVYSVRFGFGSTHVVVPAGSVSALIEDARSAPLVLLRGRTDAGTDSLADSRIARERAAAVRDYLVGAGVAPARIRTTYQPAGDHVADSSSAAGRAMNRRVEIEVYRAQPIAMSSPAAAAP